MKIKLKKENIKLPNCWKQCGVDLKVWNEIYSGAEIEVKEVPDSIKELVVITNKEKKKGSK
tara:strand:+ start:217 stop:399 length:183 start_codon:yes stop_codon:yes gene_type:complete